MKQLLKGSLVNLAAVDPVEMGRFLSASGLDSEYKRLLDSDPPRLYSFNKSKEWLEKGLGEMGDMMYWFTIRSVEEDRLLGDINLEVTLWNARDAFVGLGIGPREYWGRGYGTEAMQLILEYAFMELNLHRVSLTVFEYNPRAIRSYEKAGFRQEGRVREALIREGRRWDVLYMGITRAEWMEKYGYSNSEV